MADDRGFRRSDNIEDRRKHRVAPEISTGTFSAGQPIPNVFDGNGGLMTGLNQGDFHQGEIGPLSRDAGIDNLAPVDGPVDMSAPMPLMGQRRQAERDAIIRAAQEHGIDPTIALAIAQRESNFDPRARNSKTIRGMYQMRGDHRAKYGIGDSDDPYHQTKGWGAFFKDVKKEMASKLGRDPTDAEGYLGHHFGGVRAGRMLKMDPNTTVDQVFTPYEMSINPHFARAGTVGRLNSTILADMGKRQAKFGGAAPDLGLIDFAKMGEPVEQDPPDFSGFGDAAEPSFQAANLNMAPSSQGPNLKPSAPAASSAPDFSQFGDPVA